MLGWQALNCLSTVVRAKVIQGVRQKMFKDHSLAFSLLGLLVSGHIWFVTNKTPRVVWLAHTQKRQQQQKALYSSVPFHLCSESKQLNAFTNYPCRHPTSYLSGLIIEQLSFIKSLLSAQSCIRCLKYSLFCHNRKYKFPKNHYVVQNHAIKNHRAYEQMGLRHINQKLL